MKNLILSILLIGTIGCGTLGAHLNRDFTDGPQIKATPYMGVVCDVDTIKMMTETPWGFLAIPFLIVDVPVSAISDTVMLPFLLEKQN